MVNERTALLPVDYLDIEGVQDWLESMALEGYFLDDTIGIWWHFNGGEPGAVRYRIDPDVKKRGRIEPEKKEDFEAMGWHYVLTFQEYHIFMAEDPDTAELHTDGRVESIALKRLEKGIKWDIISFLIIFLLPYFTSRTYRTGLLSAIRYPLIFLTGDNAIMIVAYLLLAAVLIKTGFSYKRMRSLRRALDEGGTSGAVKRNARGKARRRFSGILSLAPLCIWLFLMFSSCQSIDGPEYVQNPGEVLMLENLESGKIIPDTERNENNNIWWFDKGWNLLLKEKYHIYQRCLIEGRTENGELVPVVLNADHYRCKTSQIASDLYRELVEKHISTVPDAEITVLSAGSFLDAGTIGMTEGKQTLVGQKGDVVICVEYSGDESIEENAEKIGRLMLEVPRLSQ